VTARISVSTAMATRNSRPFDHLVCCTRPFEERHDNGTKADGRRLWGADAQRRAGVQRNPRPAAAKPRIIVDVEIPAPMNSTATSASSQIVMRKQPATFTTVVVHAELCEAATGVDDQRDYRWADAVEGRPHPAGAAKMDISRAERRPENSEVWTPCPQNAPRR
jgi:hypothetical protein